MASPRGKSKQRKASQRGTVATTRLRKCECEGCGAIAYLSRKWLERGAPLCGVEGCEYRGEAMTWIDPVREETEYVEGMERDARAAIREGYAGGSCKGRKQAQCENSNCAAFLPGNNTSQTCPTCGHMPDPAVGHRQHYRTAAQRREPAPF